MSALFHHQEERFTYGDYRHWDDGQRHELIHGAPYCMSAPETNHQLAITKFIRQLDPQLDDKPCTLYPAPFDVRLPEGDESDDAIDTVVQPDISVVCDRAKIDDKGCRGAPDWLIEILSPSTGGRDQFTKFDLYEKHGVREYWILNPKQFGLAQYALRDGKFELVAEPKTGLATPTIFPEIRKSNRST